MTYGDFMVTTGQKLLWTIDFHSTGRPPEKPEINFVQKNTPIRRPIPQQAPLLIENKAQDFLNRIQDMCNKITEDCQKEAITDMDYLKKTHLVSKELGELDELIKKLNNILKWFKPPNS